MSDNKLTKEQQLELEELMNEITESAKDVVDDYEKNPSEISGSVVAIHEDSPFVDERIELDANWRRVLKGISYEDGKQIINNLLNNGKDKDAD
jgi:tripartite-type tricarboxylate transporter receptor subunit TctC